MIDFNSEGFVKLGAVDPGEVVGVVSPLLVDNEVVHQVFKGSRDFVAFTSHRVIVVNVQGMTGRKKDVTSLPYARVQAFSVESAGSFDRDAELTMWFSGLGTVRFEFRGSADVIALNRLIAAHVL